MVFLDVSKAFDKVDHACLIHKLESIGITGPLLQWFRSYLSGRRQRVVINGKSSSWANVNAVVPQGSILGPILFLIYTNDLVDRLHSQPFLFADDTSLLEVIDNPAESFTRLETDLNSMLDWAAQWRIIFNALKTVYMIFSRKLHKPNYRQLFMGNTPIKKVATHKHLGLNLSETLSWDAHVDSICAKANSKTGPLKRVSKLLARKSKVTVYQSFIRPTLEYAAVIFDGCPQRLAEQLEGIQRVAALACTGAYFHTSHKLLLSELGWDRLSTRRESQKLFYLYKMLNGLAPGYLSGLVPPPTNAGRYNLRRPNQLVLQRCRTSAFMKSFLPSSVRLWNGLDPPLRTLPTFARFKAHIKRSRHSSQNVLYTQGSGYGSLNQSRMRMGLSALNHHRHNYNFIENSKCPNCMSPREDTVHYLLICPRYAAHRHTLFAGLTTIPILPPTNRTERTTLTSTLLYGTQELNPDQNKTIFTHVQTYINSTRRF